MLLFSHILRNDIEVWGSTCKTNLTSIPYIQKMAARDITFGPWRAPSGSLFKDFDILNVDQFYNQAKRF